MKLRHYKELDGVRALAALMVMFFHFFQTVHTQDPLLLTIKKYAIFGQTGVSLFFVLSGFLITRILLNTKQSKSFFSSFYIRRSLRIFPLYYLFLIISFFLVPYLQHAEIPPFNQQIWFWCYLQNVAITFHWNWNGPGHFWSLAIEEHFYLFWPLIIYYFNTRRIKIAIVLIIIIAIITRMIMLRQGLEVFYFTLSRMDELVIGALLAVLELEGKLIPKNAKKFIFLFCIIIIPTLGLWTFTTGLAMDAIQATKFVLLSFSYFSLIGLITTIKESNWLKKIFQFKALSYTGKISYGLYVYHPLCFYLIKTYLEPDSIILSIVLSFTACFVVAGLSYYLFESRFLSLKKKFSYNE